MKRLYYIVFIGLLLLLALDMKAQNNVQGDVVVHSDPRLSLLVKKPHNMEQASVVSISHKTINKKTVRPDVESSPSAVAAAPARVAAEAKPHSIVVGKSGQQPAVWMPAESRHRGGSVYSGKGFRVQIYNGPDRNKAIQVKSEFMRNFPGVRTYLTYISPCFRVKVGDYRRRSDAEGMLREANSTYNPSMIVPDIVRISTF